MPITFLLVSSLNPFQIAIPAPAEIPARINLFSGNPNKLDF